jgi:hypothetical protein
MAHGKEFQRLEIFECEGRHPYCRLAGQTLVPEVGVQAPTDFQRVAPQTLQIGGDGSFASQVLDGSRAGYAATIQVDERPPACSPGSPGALNARYGRCSLFARFGLPADIAHHLGEPIHLVKPVEMVFSEGFETQAVCEQDGQGRGAGSCGTSNTCPYGLIKPTIPSTTIPAPESMNCKGFDRFQ